MKMSLIPLENLDTTTVSIQEAADLRKVTRQAIYVAIYINRLKAHKEGNHWRINLKDLEDYDNSLFSREFTRCDGELVYDPSKGILSIDQAHKLLGVPKQKLYYATRKGYLRASRKKSSWVINYFDLMVYKSRELKDDGRK